MLVAKDCLQVLEFLRELQEDDSIIRVARQFIWPFREALGPDVCEFRILDEQKNILL